jgi:hypothetical protein
MQLSAETFEAIVKNLKGAPPLGRDKRREPRAGLCGRADMIPVGRTDKGPRVISARVRDLSPRGIGLLLNKPLPLNSQFAIQLPCGDNAKITVIYTVRHSKALSSDLYSIGGLLRDLPGRGENGFRRSAAPAAAVAGRA